MSSQQWAVSSNDEENNVQVLPLNDVKAHLERGTYCPCQPRIEKEAGGKIVIHNAWDGREFHEKHSAHTQQGH